MNNLTESILNAEIKFNIKKVIPIEKGIQLKHSAGKAVTMDSTKYNLLKKEILVHLKEKGESTHTQMLPGQQIYCEEQKEI